MQTTVFWNAVGDDYLRRAAAFSLLSLLYQQNLSLFQLELIICTQDPQYFVPLLQHEKIRFQYVSDSFSIRWSEFGSTAICISPFTVFRKNIVPFSEQIQRHKVIWQTEKNRIAFIGFSTELITETTTCSPESIHQVIASKNVQWLTDSVLYSYSAEEEISNQLIMTIMPAKIPNLHLDQLVFSIFPKVFSQVEYLDFWKEYA